MNGAGVESDAGEGTVKVAGNSCKGAKKLNANKFCRMKTGRAEPKRAEEEGRTAPKNWMPMDLNGRSVRLGQAVEPGRVEE